MKIGHKEATYGALGNYKNDDLEMSLSYGDGKEKTKLTEEQMEDLLSYS